MKSKIIISLLVIVVVIAASLGATMAWFTDSAELTNSFTAGTLSIDPSDRWEVDQWGEETSDEWDNANPGECQKKIFTILNDGSKNVYLRLNYSGEWTALPNAPGGFTPDPELVTISPTSDELGDWTELEIDGETYWYYNGLIEDGVELEFEFLVCLDGPGTGNEYQGATYTITFNLQAVQATHYASFDIWEAGYYEGDEWYEIAGDIAGGFTMVGNNAAGTWEPTGGGEPNYLGWTY